uniref:Uncharacterized protein n=1 Tax=Nelumbo nucifera TaxID=4432 RepID=A0A822ZSL2_NELNU|nr:TPA_asm: hypothetical protein HUJ06_018170 [Nelumbo nucifera]
MREYHLLPDFQEDQNEVICLRMKKLQEYQRIIERDEIEPEKLDEKCARITEWTRKKGGIEISECLFGGFPFLNWSTDCVTADCPSRQSAQNKSASSVEAATIGGLGKRPVSRQQPFHSLSLAPSSSPFDGQPISNICTCIDEERGASATKNRNYEI